MTFLWFEIWSLNCFLKFFPFLLTMEQASPGHQTIMEELVPNLKF